MCLFALAAGPILRWLLHKGGQRMGRLLAHCGDLIFFIPDAVVGLGPILGLPCSLEGPVGLQLNLKKYVMLVVGDASMGAIRDFVLNLGPRFAPLVVSRYTEYLGVTIGPDGEAHA
eukprot:3201991-Pyramimonas_sp.AAC.1